MAARWRFPGRFPAEQVPCSCTRRAAVFSKIVASTDSGPSGSFGSVTTGPTLLNTAGEVFFWSITGYFVWSTGTIHELAGIGDVLPDGSTLGPLPLASFNDNHQTLFLGVTLPTVAPFNRKQALLLGAPNSPVVMIAKDGGATPAGGTFSVLPSSGSAFALTPTMGLNAQGDLTFWASIFGGSADSGIFRRMHTSVNLQPSAVQGQILPGGLGSLDTIPPPSPTSAPFALGPTGDVVFVNSFVTARGLRNQGAFLRARTVHSEPSFFLAIPFPGTGGVLSF